MANLYRDSSLKAYYPFISGDITTDLSGNGNNLTNNNTVGETASGKFGYAANFGDSNANKYFSLASNPAGQTYSISFWIKFASGDISTGVEDIADLRWDSGSASLRTDITYEYNSGTRRIKIGLNDVSHGNNYYYNTTLGAGWNHFVVIYSKADNNSYVYLNNSLVINQAWTAAGTTGWGNSIKLGAATTNYLDDYMDDVALFSKKLSSTEVGLLYNHSLFELDDTGLMIF